MESPILWGSEFGCCHVHVVRNWLPGLLTRCSVISCTSASQLFGDRGTLGISVFLKVCYLTTLNFFRLYSVGVVHEEAGGLVESVAYPGIFFGGVQQIQLRTEDRENGYLGAVAP